MYSMCNVHGVHSGVVHTQNCQQHPHEVCPGSSSALIEGVDIFFWDEEKGNNWKVKILTATYQIKIRKVSLGKEVI